ncbi:hypothetical protein GTQ34_16090 [Muricauda sp. JGD-17]|uniref:Uncharacterized protein n=1 Tax=Flagellimonas ochracea TaxID=2696472 RepID=A0A964TEF3_9FLAO|nr:hypothetical protein [Allomuricauda ochracea]NAY93432.1 hypothetical protein [Allomuricauda ochracea]
MKNINDKSLLSIIKIGHDVSMCEKGISLDTAIKKSKYKNIRPFLTAEILESLIAKHEYLINDWVRYSEDKRTHGGFYIGKNEIRSCKNPAFKSNYDSMSQTIANYILKELDYWTNEN